MTALSLQPRAQRSDFNAVIFTVNLNFHCELNYGARARINKDLISLGGAGVVLAIFGTYTFREVIKEVGCNAHLQSSSKC